MCGVISSTIAFADSTGSFTWGTTTATGTLDVAWSMRGNDVADARTDKTSTNDKKTKVVTYLEAQDSSKKVANQSSFDAGYVWAQASITRKGVWRFNSTHGITGDNKYIYKTYRTLSDW